MIICRDYQEAAVESVFEYFGEKDGNPIIAMPTGTGKSIVIASLIHRILCQYPDQRVMMLTHVKELIAQNYEKLKRLWPTAPAGIYSSGLGKKELYHPITFGGIASIVKSAEACGHIDLLFIDECHLVSPNEMTMYNKVLAKLKEINPFIKVIGLTATPYRLGFGYLTNEGGIFTDICFDLTSAENFNWLIDEGYLIPLIPRRTEFTLDVDNVHVRGGEYIPKELQNAVDKKDITYRACVEAKELGADRMSWLVFTTGIEHAVNTADMLNSIGITAEAIHSNTKAYPMSDSKRDDIIKRFKRGEFTALVNADMMTTGFDHPPIDLILMLRPTQSPGLWVQMLGRGTRPVYAPGFDLTTRDGRLQAIAASHKQNTLVLDFAANTKKMGPINDPNVPKQKGKQKGDAPVKVCESCNTYVHASVRICPHCGAEFKFSINLKQAASTEELIKRDLPVVEEYEVDTITYTIIQKPDKPNMLRASYYCNLKVFQDYVCLEHTGYAKLKAHKWWKERTNLPVPTTCAQAIKGIKELKTPTSLRVWVNKKYPEILAFCYDGSHFGKKQAENKNISITNIDPDEDYAPPIKNAVPLVEPDMQFDDDIPF